MTGTFWFCIKGYLLVSLIIFLCTGYAYRVNAKRTADDPQKRDYHPVSIPMIVTWPIFLLISASLFAITALAYGIFLILFTVALIAFRKPFLFKWLHKMAMKIGTTFLKANTLLIKAFFPQTRSRPA